MPTPKKGARFGGSPAHQRLMMANLATALFEHRRITTTEARARFLRPIAEKLITKAKKAELGTVESLHNRREVLKTIRDKGVVHSLFTEIGPGFAERPGGYTRITKVGPRKGDNAPMAVIELVTEPYAPKPARAKKSTTKAAAPAPVVDEPVVDEPVVDEPVADEPVVDEVLVEDEAAVEEAVETDAAETDAVETDVVETEEPVAAEESGEAAK